MARVFITGSADGLGLMAGRMLAEQGHEVVLHARNPARADEARAALPSASGVVAGDLSTVAAMRDVAEQANALGRFDAVVHNVGIGNRREPQRVATADGLCRLWAVNVLAPYVLTALMERPGRLVYLTSGLHLGGDPSLRDVQWSQRAWDNHQAYCDSKLHDIWLAFGVARLWPDVRSNAVSPGWVATRMGGPAATDDLSQGPVTQAWLAVSDDPAALETGRYLYHQRPAQEHPAARDTGLQDRLLAYCAEVSGVQLKP
jgi:NAD(P)-dependent dehydrogenase (short-subunit alcohol dehydrogenase family)